MFRRLQLFLLFMAAPLVAQSAPHYSLQEVMIPMRDGVRLHTAIYRPDGINQRLPFLISRTPYGTNTDEGRFNSNDSSKELREEGYIFVGQDIRGRFKSEGKFVMQRDPRDDSDPKSIDEGTDTYDTIEWLLKNVSNNNGRAGIFGISYGGWLTTMALLEPHPALKAASEQASPADMFLGDDFHHNGAFRLSYGFEYSYELEHEKEANTLFPFDRYDLYDWYLTLGPLSNANGRYFHGQIPSWNDFVAHPNYDEFWKKQVFATYLTKTTVPNLNVAGWYDQEDFYGPMKIYELYEKNDSAHLNFIVSGPWNHGGWGGGTGRSLGEIDFGSDTAQYFRAQVQAPWFAYWLKDKGTLKQPEALVFQTGSNKWEQYDAWPPKQATARKLYMQASGALSFKAPADAGDEAFDQYVSDPANPVPYRHRPISPTYPAPPRAAQWRTWLLEDQRFVDHRPDVLTWQTEPLQEDVTIAGDIVADLFASTSGSDSDWIVKLIDVYPEDYPANPELGGYELIIADEVFRGRFRAGFEHPQAITPNAPLEYRIDLHANDHAFLKDHRIMVQVQSTWFPLIDRNPQTFVPNIFEAKQSDYRAATQRIYRSREHASSVVLPVIGPAQ
jgi:putative CocE/NonD family hydrolase